MSSFLLTWNPDRWERDEADLRREVELTASGRRVLGRWAVGVRRRGIDPGDRVYLLRQRSDRGLVASGIATSDVMWADHWDDSGRQTTYVDVEWDVVLPPDDPLPIGLLKSTVPQVPWDRLQGSGVRVPSEAERLLEDVWRNHVGQALVNFPEELLGTRRYVEGAVARVEVNRYERDRAARQACIDHWGTSCVVCGFHFEAAYGQLGRGFVNVHHLTELSTLGADYELDAISELRPVCPNCHAMLHRKIPALTIAQLRRRLRGAGGEAPRHQAAKTPRGRSPTLFPE